MQRFRKHLFHAMTTSWVGVIFVLTACSSASCSGKSVGEKLGSGGVLGSGGDLAGSGGGPTESPDASIAGAGGPSMIDSSTGSDGLDGGTTDPAGDGGNEVAAPSLMGDDFVSDVKVEVHSQTSTILVVTWTQLIAADAALLEFTFAGSAMMTSRAQQGAIGAHRDVILGIPEKTAVTVRIVSKLAGVEYKTKDYQGTTGAVPSSFPRAQVLAYDPDSSSPERWMLGAVEGGPGGCSDIFSCYYLGPYWIYIMDRQGRIVWYWADMSDDASSSYPHVARDGEYIVIDKGRGGNTGVVKMTLDRQYYQFTAIKDLDDAIDVTSDGSVLYDTNGELFELTKQGTTRSIWSCSKYFGTSFECYSNTVNWVPADDTVLLSFPGPCVVVQVDRKTGALAGLYGSVAGSYAFSPSPWRFQFPHSPTITPDGTLLVSTHLPDYPETTPAGPNHHAFEEFSIDRAARKLTQKWIYSDGPEWANAKGFALRLANGNTLANYGTGGVIREITPDKRTVFQVKFPAAASSANPYYNRMVGSSVYVDDLYALNGGGPQ